jgi:hypothetical protein
LVGSAGIQVLGWGKSGKGAVGSVVVVQSLTRRHTVRKLVTRSRSSTRGIPGPGAPFAFMR